MSWMPRPFRTKTKKVPFDQFRFPSPNLETSLEGYARFIFARVAFVKGTPCALLKNKRFIPKGDLTLLHVRQHVEREGVLGISLAQKSTNQTKTVCTTFTNTSVIDALGQGCRLLTSLNQAGIQGLIELCPNERVRVWAFFDQPQLVSEAVERVKSLKARAFITNDATFSPTPGSTESYLELPPFPDPDTGQWSVVMSLETAEQILVDVDYPIDPPDWDVLLGDFQMESHVPGERLGILEVLDSPAELSTSMGSESQADEAQTEAYAGMESGQSTASAPAGSNLVYFPRQPETGEGAPETDGGEPSPASPQPVPFSDEESTEAGEPQTIQAIENEQAPDSKEAKSTAKAYTLSPLSASVPAIIGQLLNPTRVTIPSPSPSMNEVLNGGWTIQRVYLIAGGSGEGKTTFCAWAADYAASHHVPVVYVSFQAPKELLSIYALARTAKIDSALIESGLCKAPRPRSEDLRKILMNAGRKYFRTGDYLHVLEADSDTTLADIREAVSATRQHFGLEEGDPVIVVIDSIRELRADFDKEGKHKTGRSRISQIMLQMKEIAQTQNAAILVTMDTPTGGGMRAGAGTMEQSDFETASGLADTCFVLDSRAVLHDLSSEETSLRRRNSSRLQDPLDRVLDQFGQQPVLAKRLQAIRKEYPLEERSASTYARMWTVKNRGGRTDIQPIFRYHKAFHDFEPIPIEMVPVVD